MLRPGTHQATGSRISLFHQGCETHDYIGWRWTRCDAAHKLLAAFFPGRDWPTGQCRPPLISGGSPVLAVYCRGFRRGL